MACLRAEVNQLKSAKQREHPSHLDRLEVDLDAEARRLASDLIFLVVATDSFSQGRAVSADDQLPDARRICRVLRIAHGDVRASASRYRDDVIDLVRVILIVDRECDPVHGNGIEALRAAVVSVARRHRRPVRKLVI